MILVTGGTGMVGAHLLLHLLEKGKKVKALKRKSSHLSITEKVFNYYEQSDLLKHIEWIDGDVQDIPSLELAMQGCERVYHAAALVSFTAKDVKKMLDINVQGTSTVSYTHLTLPTKRIV